MKSTDLRAKARAIFGPAIAEPMPNQPNGAKALQQRANARPIPTYKVGGAVKKADGGGMGMKKPAIKPLRRSPEADDVLMTTPRGKRMLEEQKKRDAERERMGMAKRAVADKLLGIPAQKKGGKAGCYSEGGRMKGSTDSARMKGSTDAARMKGSTDSARMSVTPDEKRKKITLNEKRVRVPSIEYKDGGKAKSKPKSGLAVMIAIGKPMKGMKKPVKRAVGGAGKTRKGMCK